MYQNFHYLESFMDHIETQGIADLFVRFLNVSQSTFEEQATYDEAIINRNKLLIRLVEKLAPETSEMQKHCATQILNELTEIKAVYEVMCGDEIQDLLLTYIESKDVMSQKYGFWILGYLALKFKTHE